MVSSLSRPWEYTRIKYKRQITRYKLLHVLGKHPYEQGESNWLSKWWQEWYTYKNIKDLQEILYSQHILIRTKESTKIKKYIQWAT